MIQKIDDFLDKDLYDFIVGNRNGFNYRFIDGDGEAKKHEALLGKELTDRIKQNYIDKVGPTVGHFSVGIVRCDPVYHYNMHADHPTKLVSCVVYLHPKRSTGTIFEKDNREMLWKPNRLIAWENRGQRHFYENRTAEPRYTLNIYQKSEDTNFEVVKIPVKR